MEGVSYYHTMYDPCKDSFSYGIHYYRSKGKTNTTQAMLKSKVLKHEPNLARFGPFPRSYCGVATYQVHHKK